jgi:antitoxin component YwqK of YwqJK toxin-antitoxin module
MRSLTIICFLFYQQLFAQDTIYFDTQWKPASKKTAVYYRVEKKEDGLWNRNDFYAGTHQLQMKGTYESIDPEIKSGSFVFYHKNGRPRHVGLYKADKEIGEHKWYFENGNIEAIEYYMNGKLNGAFQEFHENGNPSIQAVFKDGVQTGKTIYFRETGVRLSDGEFKKGDRIGTWNFYDETGKISSTHEYKLEYEIAEASMFMKLPNSDWDLVQKVEGAKAAYIFKRAAVQDKDGMKIIPAIMVYAEDAKEYNQDVTVFSTLKRMQFKGRGIKVDKILGYDSKDYPLSYKNSLLTMCSYSTDGMDHILYMIHIINKNNKGIQVYMDITKSLPDEYEKEFWVTMRSLKEIR